MAAVSSISAMKVEMPRSWQSPAPTRAKMQSRTAMRACSHATKQPTWAISTATPTCSPARKYKNSKIAGEFVQGCMPAHSARWGNSYVGVRRLLLLSAMHTV